MILDNKANIWVAEDQNQLENTPEVLDIKANFWTGSPPVPKELYTISCENVDFTQPLTDEMAKKIMDTYDEHGLVLLTNTGVKDIEVLNPYIELLIPRKMVYEGGANSRNASSKNFYEVGAPDAAFLHYHHEMTYVTHSTLMLAFACKYSCDTVGKGYTYVSENIGATKAILKTELGRKLKEKGICFIRRLTDRREYKGEEESVIYNHWQKSFGVETEEEAEKACEKQKLKFEWGPDPRGKKGYLTTRFYTSAFEYCPKLDKNLLYASIADDAMWFDGWPGIADTPRADRDLKMTYGDDTEITDQERQLWVDIYDQHGIPLEWKQGDLAMVCNYRYAHGRPGFTLEPGEKRELGVVLGESFAKVGQKPDKWYSENE